MYCNEQIIGGIALLVAVEDFFCVCHEVSKSSGFVFCSAFFPKFEYYVYLWQQFLSADGITHKLSVIFNGPGWTPGKPRLGDPEDLPEVGDVSVFSHNLYL